MPLCRWKGVPPASGSVADVGDARFEASRAEAIAELRQIVEGERSVADHAALSARIHRARYRTEARRVRLADLSEAWAQFPRKRAPVAAHVASIMKILQSFVDYMKEAAPKATELGEVSSAHARGFMEAQEARGVSPKTWNVYLSTLRSVFKRLDPHASGYTEYLQNQPMRDEGTVHRVPFTGEELNRILGAAQEDELMRPLIVTAITTAMRRGDVCRLRWSDVDLAAGFMTVKTAKTGGTVEIPIFPMLHAELARRPRNGEFVFPDAARLYRDRPDKLDQRLGDILAAAGIEGGPGKRKCARVPVASLEEIQSRAFAAIQDAGWHPKKTARAQETLTAYLSGRNVKQIASETGISVASVSGYLNALEEMTGLRIVRRVGSVESSTERTQAESEEAVSSRLRRPSLRGWHSFRTTFITLALSSGIPMELVRRVTGHATVDVVLKHYFRPGREDFRAAIEKSGMPAALIGAQRLPKQERQTIPASLVIKVAREAPGKSWQNIQGELLALCAEDEK